MRLQESPVKSIIRIHRESSQRRQTGSGACIFLTVTGRRVKERGQASHFNEL